MNILIIGTNTINKGAELMLYAVLQQIRQMAPDAIVHVPYSGIPQGLKYIETPLEIRYLPGFKLNKWYHKLHLDGICRRLRLPYPWFSDLYPQKKIDVVIDAGGFQFSDQFWADDDLINRWLYFITRSKKNGTKLIFLPQAYGPFKTGKWIPVVQSIANNADLMFVREQISSKHLTEIGIPPMPHIHIAPDFTSILNGKIDVKFEHLKGQVGVIPNIQMINNKICTFEDYIKYLSCIIATIKKNGRKVFLLNHEGKRDYDLCKRIVKSLANDIEIVSDLPALQIKGIIAQSYLMISSRFHGVASALSCSVPCLATSWSHKYELLFAEYGVPDSILSMNIEKDRLIIESLLQSDVNSSVRTLLKKRKMIIDKKTNDMWTITWSCINK